MAMRFQSSPSPKAGSYLAFFTSFRCNGLFQSSPSPKAGSYPRRTVPIPSGGCFNPLPARRPGATESSCCDLPAELVSILSQPEGRELLSFSGLPSNFLRFQSSPSPKAGSYYSLHSLSIPFICFNPLPARRPGATITLPALDEPDGVSILSQPEGRELLWILPPEACLRQFQSSPSPKAGSYGRPGRSSFDRLLFQSSPSPKAGSYMTDQTCCKLGHAFQSSPSPKAGSYVNEVNKHAYKIAFQSSPSPKAGSYRTLLISPSLIVMFQSSPSPKAGSY